MFSAPRFAPSNLNCTPATPRLSEALAAIVTDIPETPALFSGDVIVTVGRVISVGGSAIVGWAVLPAASQVALPPNKVKDSPLRVLPSKPTCLARTSKRAHFPTAGNGPA